MNEPYHTRQLWAAAVTACFAPAAVFCARQDVRWVALAGGLLWIYDLYMWHLAQKAPAGKSMADLAELALGKTAGRALQGLFALWFFLVACFAARQAAQAFPQSSSFPFVPVVLILLSAWATGKGVAVVVRCCSVLFFFLTAVFLVVLGFGVTQVHWTYLRPWGGREDVAAALAVLLLPAVVLQFRDRARGQAATGLWSLGLLALALGVSLVTVGSLGPRLAAAVQTPFYLVVETISIFGVMERFEALISAALIASYFAFICLFSLASAQNLKKILSCEMTGPLARGICVAILLFFWLADRIEPMILAVGSLLFSAFLPLTILVLVQCKIKQKK